MKHEKFREIILRQALGREISPAEARGLAKHLGACQACQEFNERLASERLGARGREILPAPRLRPDFKREFLARLAQEEQIAQAKPGLGRENQATQAKPGLSKGFQNLLAVAASIPLILTSLYLGHLALKNPSHPDSLKSSLADDPLKLAVKRASGIAPSDFELRLEHGERTVYQQAKAAQTRPLAAKQDPQEDSKIQPEVSSKPRVASEVGIDSPKSLIAPEQSLLLEKARAPVTDQLSQVASEAKIESPKSMIAPEQGLLLEPKNEQAGDESSGLARTHEPQLTRSELAYLGVDYLNEPENEETPRQKALSEERPELEAESLETLGLKTPREQLPTQAKELVETSIPTVAVRLELSRARDLDLARHRAEEIKLALKKEFPAGTEIQLESGIVARQEPEDPIESKLKASQEAEDPIESAKSGKLSKPETSKSVIILLWLGLAGLVRLFNIIAGALRPEKRAPRLDLVLGALLGSLWLPRVISRLIGSR